MRTRGHIQAGTIYKHALRLPWKTRRSTVGRNSGGECGIGHTISKRVRRSSCSFTIVPWTKQSQASPAYQKRLDGSRLAATVNVAAADLREVDRDGGNSAADCVLLRVAAEAIPALQRTRRAQTKAISSRPAAGLCCLLANRVASCSVW